MTIIEMKTEELIPYINNPRKNDDAVDYVAASIKEFGFKVPIVVDKDNVIVTGHTRLKAAKKLGLETVPVIKADDLTESQIKAFRLADNKVSEFAEWDMEKLGIELEGLEDFDMDGFGFDMDALLEKEKDPEEIEEDEVPEPPEEPKSKPGDIYQLGKHRLMCGDSTKPEDVEKLMDGEKADLVITDPPYNVGIGTKNKDLNSTCKKNGMPLKGGQVETDLAGDKYKTDEEAGEKLWEPAFSNMLENADDKCAIYCFMPQGGAHMMMMMMMHEAGWQVKHELIWVKNNASFSMGRLDYDYKHEPILYGWKNGHNFYAEKNMNSVLMENKPLSSKLHPTMKPVKLIARLMNNSSRKDELVLDLFGGSGTTLIAAEQMGRKCRMMELDPHYVDVIIERWENLTGEKAAKIDV